MAEPICSVIVAQNVQVALDNSSANLAGRNIHDIVVAFAIHDQVTANGAQGAARESAMAMNMDAPAHGGTRQRQASAMLLYISRDNAVHQRIPPP